MIRRLITIICFLYAGTAAAQPQAELLPGGFATFEIDIPATPNEKLVELSKNWAMEYNHRKTLDQQGYDITDVTETSLTITAYRRNAFYYTNRGEAFDHDIRYEMRLAFNENRYTLQFVVIGIYLDNSRIEYLLLDYFTTKGELKEGYSEIKPSLEATVNSIIKSHYNFIINFR